MNLYSTLTRCFGVHKVAVKRGKARRAVMSVIHNRYPCCHQPARLPMTEGWYQRRCRLCKVRYRIVIERGDYISQRVGDTVYVATWVARVPVGAR